MSHDDKKIKIIDVEKQQENDDNEDGPIDVVDIFDEVTEGTLNNHTGKRHKYLYDNENPADNEDQDVLNENEFESQPDRNEKE